MVTHLIIIFDINKIFPMRQFCYLLWSFVCVTRILAQDFITPELKSNGKPWTTLQANDDNFQFVVITDRTGGHRPGVFETGVAKINLVQPEFVVSVGDLIEGYTEDRQVLDREWAEFEGFIEKFEMPFFYVAGNHDYTNPVMADLWKEKFGVEYYHFVYKNVLFLCLNSEDGATHLVDPDLSESQLEYTRAALAQYPQVRWTMVFMHQPLWSRESAKNWLKLEETLSQRKHTVFTGHQHQYTIFERNKSDYFTLATMGGASGLRGRNYGEFDHFMWVTMTDRGPYYANIMLDGIFDKSIYNEQQLAKAPSYELLAPIKQMPLFTSTTGISTLDFEVTNPDDLERKINIDFRDGEFMKTVQSKFQTTIGPKEKTVFSIPVVSKSNPQAKGQPIRSRVEFIGEDFVWSRNYRAVVNPHLVVPSVSATIKLDGDLKDWRKINHFQGALQTSDSLDATASFMITRTADALYISALVIDDEIYPGWTKNAYEHDGFMVSLDARPASQSVYNPRSMAGLLKGEWVFLIMQPTANTFGLAHTELLPMGITGAGKRTKGGYQLEIKIPHSILDQFQGKSWENIRLNFTLIDKDDKQKPAIYNWVADWKDHNVGSGLVFKE